MYDRHLDAFVKVIELGSFSKAAKELFMSPTAVIKQVNLLERDMGMSLLERKHSGVVATPAGQVVYEGAIDMMERARDIAARARKTVGDYPTTVRLAVSVLRPARTVSRLWRSRAGDHPGVKLATVRVEDNFDTWCDVLRRIGGEIDVSVVITPSDDAPWMEACGRREIYHEPLCVAVPSSHRLASKERLSIEDLHGEQLSMAPPGTSPYVDELRAYLAAEHPTVAPDTRPPYDLTEFNRCANANELLLSCPDWDDVHPEMVNKEVDWGNWHGTLGFSILFPKQATPPVQEFVDTICEACAE